MSGFSNAIIGGLSNLIRTAIQSPNYIAGLSGWAVKKDGTAEFQSLTARGNLTANAVILPSTAVFADPGSMQWVDPSNPAHRAAAYQVSTGSRALVINGLGSAFASGSANLLLAGMTAGGEGSVILAPGYATASGYANSDTTIGALFLGGPGLAMIANNIGVNRIQIGAGVMAGYYFERVDLPAQVIPLGAPAYTQLANLAAGPAGSLLSDYGSKFNLVTGVWTCPVTGVYTLTLAFAFTAWGAGATIQGAITRNGTAVGNMIAREERADIAGAMQLTVQKNLTAGDTVTFRVAHNVTGGRTVATGDPSYISIRRVL